MNTACGFVQAVDGVDLKRGETIAIVRIMQQDKLVNNLESTRQRVQPVDGNHQ